MGTGAEQHFLHTKLVGENHMVNLFFMMPEKNIYHGKTMTNGGYFFYEMRFYETFCSFSNLDK